MFITEIRNIKEVEEEERYINIFLKAHTHINNPKVYLFSNIKP